MRVEEAEMRQIRTARPTRKGGPAAPVLGLALALAAGNVAAQPATGSFGAWNGLCDPTSCRISTSAQAPGDLRYRAGLRIEAERGGTPRIVLSPLPPLPGETSLLDVSVDGERLSTLPAETGWRQTDSRNDFAIVDPVSQPKVLAAMRPGGRIEFAWSDRAGSRRTASFSLIGVTAGLTWLERNADISVEPQVATTATGTGRDPEAIDTPWAQNPAAFLPAITACQLAAPASFARVLTATRWTESEDAVLVSDSVGLQRLCMAVRDGSRVTDFRPVLAEDRLPPIGPILTPSPVGPCYANESLIGEDGAVVGVLSRNIC